VKQAGRKNTSCSSTATTATTMDFFCLPIICGVSQKIHPEDGQSPRMCPRCNNAAVVSAKKKTYFELFCVPVFPMSSKHVWVCGICQWRVPLQQGWEPPFPGQGSHHPPQGQWQQGPPPGQTPPQGYAPGYPPPVSPGHPNK